MRNLLLLLLCLLAPAWGATTTSTTFAATGNGPTIQILPNSIVAMTGTYSITGSFTATLAWQYSPDQNNWTSLQTYTGTQAAITFSNPGFYRWSCTAYTSGSPVGVIVVQPYVYQQINDFGGNVLLQVDTSGVTAPTIVTPSGGTTGQTLTGNVNNYFQLLVTNTNAGSSASSDFVAQANDGTPSTHYVDLGINGSTGGTAPFTAAHEAYVYSSDNVLDIGALGASGILNFQVGATPTNMMTVGVNGVTVPLTTGQKLAFYGSTPVVQQTGDVATALSTLGLVATPTIAATNGLDGTFTINNTADQTKQFKWNLANQTTGTQLTLNSGAQTASRTLSVPVLSGADTLMTLAVPGTITGTATFSVPAAFTQTTGTAPFTVSSTTNVANLNASSLNGNTFANPGAIGSGTAATTINASGVLTNTNATAANNGATAGAIVASAGGISANGAVQTATGFGYGSTPTATNILNITTSTTNGFFQGQVVNSSTGTSALAGLVTSNGTHTSSMTMYGTAYTTSAPNRQDGAQLSTAGAGGINLNASNSTGQIDFWTNGSSRGSVSSSGVWTLGPTSNPTANTFAGPIIYGRNNAAADTAGSVGETITGAFSGVAAAATTVTGNVGSVSLTAGKWLVSSKVVIHSGTTGLTSGSTIQVSCPVATAGTGTSGTTMAQETVFGTIVASSLTSISVDAQVVNITSTTSEFLTCNITYAAGSPTIDGSITAVRLP